MNKIKAMRRNIHHGDTKQENEEDSPTEVDNPKQEEDPEQAENPTQEDVKDENKD